MLAYLKVRIYLKQKACHICEFELVLKTFAKFIANKSTSYLWFQIYFGEKKNVIIFMNSKKIPTYVLSREKTVIFKFSSSAFIIFMNWSLSDTNFPRTVGKDLYHEKNPPYFKYGWKNHTDLRWKSSLDHESMFLSSFGSHLPNYKCHLFSKIVSIVIIWLELKCTACENNFTLSPTPVHELVLMGVEKKISPDLDEIFFWSFWGLFVPPPQP